MKIITIAIKNIYSLKKKTKTFSYITFYDISSHLNDDYLL